MVSKNETGFYHFRLWRNPAHQIIGQQLSIFEYQAYVNDGWHILSFQGYRGTVCVLIEDMTLTRLDALAFAIKFMEGNLVTISIDLRELTSTTTAVIPPP